MRAASLPTNRCPPSFPEQARGACHSHGLGWGSDANTRKEPRPTEASGGGGGRRGGEGGGRLGAGPRLPPAAQTSPPPFRGWPSGRPCARVARTTPAEAPASPCRAKERAAQRRKSGFHSPFRRRFRKWSALGVIQPSTCEALLPSSPSPKTGLSRMWIGKQCLHSKPNGFQKNPYSVSSHTSCSKTCNTAPQGAV